MKITKSLLKGHNGRTPPFTCAVTTPKKTKMRERGKEKERDYFLKILDIIEETVFVIDRDLRILDLSKGCLNKFRNGVEREVAIGKRCYEGLWGLEAVCEGCPVSSVFEKGEVARTERSFSLSNGTNRYFDIEWIPVFDEHGEVTRVIGDIRDVTERKESEEKLAKIVDGLSISTIVINSEHNITHWNAAVESLTGLKREEVVGTDKQWLPFYPEKRPVMADLIVNKAPESEIKARYGDKYKKSSLIEGAYEALDFFPSLGKGGKWLLFTAAPLREPNGNIVGAIETLQDVTERKNAEEKLTKIVDGVNIPAFAINKEHKITHWNTAVESLTGLKREEVVGTDKQWLPFYLEKRPVMADLIVDKAPESEIKARYGDKYKKSSLIEGAYEALDFFPTMGEEGKWLLFTAAPLKGSNGDIIGAIETLQDVTERKNAEEQSKTIFEHVRTPLCLIEEDETITSVNKEFEALSGYSREEVGGKKWTEFVAPEDLEKVINHYYNWKKVESPCCDFKFVDRDGEIRDVKVCIVPIPGGKIKVASITDLTQLKREEELCAICEELKELDDMKRNFLNAAYHELRSPLTPIVGYASLLKCDELGDKQKDYVHNIEKYAEQLRAQINRMLELARIDGGEMEMTMEDVPIPEIVEGVVKSFKPLWNEKEQTINTLVPEGIEVRGDKLKIIAILTNLIVNAIKYTYEGGRINIMVEDRGEDIRVCVADTGIGIPEKHLPKIFERFYMVNTSLTRKSESLGLGLSIVKEYVKLHGGHIWATSELGKGSKFFFTLPKKENKG
ncbi:MAG TPA: PAS domain S-box protein [Candidatus Bathyarchaeia archaeon]|nr:PAS domain S-box protein [Candidatus Bathyarchaeia archaeon]